MGQWEAGRLSSLYKGMDQAVCRVLLDSAGVAQKSLVLLLWMSPLPSSPAKMSLHILSCDSQTYGRLRGAGQTFFSSHARARVGNFWSSYLNYSDGCQMVIFPVTSL
ncbi:hypothetical protein H1C71_036238 [Ictidomys tridecemlineatus]|nr:hypothetical protein H1C71_036238 [Ictidomys tridecemlineatus]